MKKIIFDLDDTLIDWIDEYDYPLRDTLNQYGINFDYKLLSKSIDEYDYESNIYNSYDLLKYLNEKHNLNLTIEFINDWLERLGNTGSVSKEVDDLLRYLSSKYELVCLTNWASTCQIARLKHAGIYKYFKNLYGGEVYKKPSVEALNKAIGNSDISECIMVGNNYYFDIEPAKKLGIKTYQVGKDIKSILDLKEML